MNLTIDNAGKLYKGGLWGLRSFSLSLGPGVLGLLGPNGAGKSTLMRILATITKPTEGRVTWNGTDVAERPDAVREVLGYLPQDFGVYPNLDAVEFLEYIAAAKGLDGPTAKRRIDELLELVNLTGVRRRPVGKFSGGMKQRVGIAQALLNDPRLLIVDEPTGGLDPEERVRFRNLLSELSGERIVILSTHIVSDVEATAADIAIVAEGKLVARGTPEALVAKAREAGASAGGARPRSPLGEAYLHLVRGATAGGASARPPASISSRARPFRASGARSERQKSNDRPRWRCRARRTFSSTVRWGNTAEI